MKPALVMSRVYPKSSDDFMGEISSDLCHAPEPTSETDFMSSIVSSPLSPGPCPSFVFDHDGTASQPKTVSDLYHLPLQKDMSAPTALRQPYPGAAPEEVSVTGCPLHGCGLPQPMACGDCKYKSKSELILSCVRNFLIFLKDVWSLALTCANALCSVVNAFSVLLCLLMSLAFASYVRLDTVAAPPRAPPTMSVVFEGVQTSAELALERCFFQVLTEFFQKSLVALPLVPMLGLLNHE